MSRDGCIVEETVLRGIEVVVGIERPLEVVVVEDC